MLDLTIEKKPKKKLSILQFLPKRLETISNDKYIEWKDDRLKVSYIVDILHNLILKYYFTKENYFNLSSLILRSKYGALYSRYMDFLVQNNYIQMVSNYYVNKKTKSYVIDNSILIDQILRYRNQDEVLLKKYNRSTESLQSQSSNFHLIDIDVKAKMVSDLYSINIDFDKASFYLNEFASNLDIYNKNMYSIQSIRDGNIFFHFDDYGRMHSNFTILKTFIRKSCLTIDGDEIVEIDIANSQPLFLVKLIEESFLNRDIDTEELSLFKNLTHTGKLYQYLMGLSDIKERNDVKKMIYQVFFGKNWATKSDKLFQRAFPTIYQFIKKYKKVNEDYRVLAYQLQKMESDFLFNGVIKDLMNLYPEIKIFTVHDSITYPKKYQKEIESLFNQHLLNTFGITSSNGFGI